MRMDKYHENGVEEEHIPGERGKTGINEVGQKFINDLIEEKARVGDDLPIVSMLIDEAIEKVQQTGRIPGRELQADVYNQRPIKISQTVFVPVKEFPKFNFTGKILGPKGNSLRRLQQETQCKITIKGRNSMRDRVKEEEFRTSGDPKYAHLNKNLFLVISTVGVPAECYAKIAYALAEIRKYLVPDKNDDVSQQQLQEIMRDPEMAKKNSKMTAYKSLVARGGKSTGKDGFQKYMSLVQKSFESEAHPESYRTEYDEPNSENEVNNEEEEYQYVSPKRSRVTAVYDHSRVAPKRAPRLPQKRIAAPPKFATEVKRVRGAQSYNLPPYAINKKY